MISLVSHFQIALFLSAFAALTEACFGYPEWCYRLIGHPVMWIGKLISLCDTYLNTSPSSMVFLRLKGILALCFILIISGGSAFVIERACFYIVPYFIAGLFCAIFASTFIASRSLYQHVAHVGHSLQNEGIEKARLALSHIVGRDTSQLEEQAILRAAIESLAENFSDGVTAPLFWGGVGGFTGIAVYKAINTADSMIGHLSKKYKYFGWASARLDDVVNIPASRITALWIILVAFLSSSLSARRAWNVVYKQARLHRSPNAGWPEAAMAGALGIRLAGPRIYQGIQTDMAWMGEGLPDPHLSDLFAALAVFRQACMLQIVFLLFLAFLFFILV